ncbi:hypothetical protein ACROYT_G030117 [Oculina patagonica]
MASRKSSSSSEEALSEESSPNALNFYDSDVGELSELSEDVGPRPYRFEPRRVQRNVQERDDSEPQSEEETDRLGNTDWCECGSCRAMPTPSESVCCTEIGQVWQKIEDQRPEVELNCITQHPGFASNCLDVWVLETAYYAYRQQHGAVSHTAHEKFRYIAYRQLVRWCWGYLGKNVRVALPSCAVNKIRDTFPADFGNAYTGLKPPNL